MVQYKCLIPNHIFTKDSNLKFRYQDQILINVCSMNTPLVVRQWCPTEYFLLSWKIPEVMSRWSIPFITKGSIYYIKHNVHTTFYMEVDWWEIWHQMDVSTMFYICKYCVFTLWGRMYIINARREQNIGQNGEQVLYDKLLSWLDIGEVILSSYSLVGFF